jgi:hypothetical protein
VLDNYSELFDGKTGEPRKAIPIMTHASRNLFRCQVFTTTLTGFSDVLVEWLEMLLEIEKRNPKSVFQFPGGGTKAVVEAANDKEGGGNPLEMGGANDDASSTSTLVEGKGSESRSAKDTKIRKSYGQSSPYCIKVRHLTIQRKTRTLVTPQTFSRSSGDYFMVSGKALLLQRGYLHSSTPWYQSLYGFRQSRRPLHSSRMRTGTSFPIHMVIY